MTVLDWPATLPRPLRSGYQGQLVDPRLAKNAEVGPPGYRRRYSSVPRTVAMSVVVSRSQKAEFEQFHVETLRHGTLPFWMPDPTTDGWALLTDTGAPLLTSAGAPVSLAARWLCLFGTPPSETLRGQSFTLSFNISVMP
ncbi:hypothetical protein DU478_17430 [Thalassococcus profundi]|uniref:Uncharacterized protein n=1 Tax=Thalassococcus profundi TaxID=2282382 RepID=A0A369TI47_9RHOB|nr:hypothetical protein [Thalassococcus profundi]RDD64983.1 hypothetical protein DU478_17430 [Thalassococcus profundi]